MKVMHESLDGVLKGCTKIRRKGPHAFMEELLKYQDTYDVVQLRMCYAPPNQPALAREIVSINFYPLIILSILEKERYPHSADERGEAPPMTVREYRSLMELLESKGLIEKTSSARGVAHPYRLTDRAKDAEFTAYLSVLPQSHSLSVN